MSDAHPVPGDASHGHIDEQSDPADMRGDRGSGHGHDTEASEPLGPIDLTAWAFALGGTGLGLLAVFVLFLASA
jgi:hypothetical protein